MSMDSNTREASHPRTRRLNLVPAILLLAFFWSITSISLISVSVQVRNGTFDLAVPVSFWAVYFVFGFGALAIAMTFFVRSRWH